MRYVFILLLALVLALSSLAQNSYMIRLDTEANLRESWSLDSDLVARAPAGAELAVSEHFNRWLKVSYEGSELWMADWVMHTRLSDDGMMQPEPTSVPVLLTPPPVMSYMIRLNTEANLREQYSLDSDILSVQPAGALLTVNQRFNRWLRVMNDDSAGWMADWVMHTRLTDEEATMLTMPPPPPPPVVVDNCCFVDRSCTTDEEWLRGYREFHANWCPVPEAMSHMSMP